MEKFGLVDLKTKAAGNKKRFFVSSASVATSVDEKVLNTIFHFCKNTLATPIILGGRAHVRALESQPQFFDSRIRKTLGDCIVSDFVFSELLYAVDAQINPQQITPLTSMGRYKFRGNAASLFVSSPKLSLEAIASGNSETPRLLMSTGAITKPIYQKNRNGKLAQQMHKIGGWIVEILDDGLFLVRPVYFDKKGSFIDLGVRFNSDGTQDKVDALGLVLGDLHSENIRRKSLKISLQQLDFFKPHYTVLHDILSFESISHHSHNKKITRIKQAERFPSLEQEMRQAFSVIDLIAKHSRQFVIPSSNHHNHLMRWLEEERYRDQIINYELGLKLAQKAIHNSNILQEVYDPAKKHIWLSPNEDFKIAGVNVGSHGHLGANGSRGNPKTFTSTYGASIAGHNHSPLIIEDHVRVGTNSEFDLDYNVGPSNWLQANAVVYDDGTVQLLISVPKTEIWHNKTY